MQLEPISILPRDRDGRPFDVISTDPKHPHTGQYGPYLADAGLLNAANTALGLQLPLLLTGEPGCGKSDFAYVAAHALGLAQPLSCYIRSDTRARELLYHYDALRRFGDSQHGDRVRAQEPRHYVRLRPLGVALMSSARQVVLLDEIDKAPRDLPNDLLRELDEGHFEIAEIDGDAPGQVPDPEHRELQLRRVMQRPTGARKPFIVITSNAERQLPEPFLRRCVFYHIPPPTPKRLQDIAERRFGDRGPLVADLTRIFVALRKHAEQAPLAKPPTTSEMLAWIDALTGVYQPTSVTAALASFTGPLAAPGAPMLGALPWATLPGLSVLIKLRDDLLALGHGRTEPG